MNHNHQCVICDERDEIIKRLKEGLSQWKMNRSIPAWIVFELQKILEGKK